MGNCGGIGFHENLYEAGARLALRDMRDSLGRRALLSDIPAVWVDELAERGFDWVWLQGVWQTGEEGRRRARSDPGVLAECERACPGLDRADIVSSPYSVADYRVNDEFGGAEALDGFRRRLAQRGIRLMLDFVPNHLALDHPWARERPELFVNGTAKDVARRPRGYARMGGRALAHGRDPFFPAWRDTLQLDYGRAETRLAMTEVLAQVSRMCDGVRCDMAMLVLSEVFSRTWPERGDKGGEEFWAMAIDRVRRERPDFVFMAEAYWGLEARLCDLGFDFAYDKGFYDDLRRGDARAVRERLRSEGSAAARFARFVENHDEPRAAAVFEGGALRPAAALAALTPGIFLFHDGQREGRRVRAPVQLGRRPKEAPDHEIEAFYDRLLAVTRRPEVREGAWSLLETREAWQGNPTWENFVAFAWTAPGERLLIVAANLGETRGQCFVGPGVSAWKARAWAFRDLLGDESFERDGDDLAARGLYLDVPPRACQAFAVSRGSP